MTLDNLKKTMESKIQKQIINYIEKDLQGYCVKILRCNKNGFPDLHFLLPTEQIPFYCEVKKKNKTARAMQLYRMEELRKYGGVAFEADSLNEFKQKLSNI